MESSVGEDLKALSFVRRSLLKKNEKIRELTAKVRKLTQENERLQSYQWKCEELEKEVLGLQTNFGSSKNNLDPASDQNITFEAEDGNHSFAPDEDVQVKTEYSETNEDKAHIVEEEMHSLQEPSTYSLEQPPASDALDDTEQSSATAALMSTNSEAIAFRGLSEHMQQQADMTFDPVLQTSGQVPSTSHESMPFGMEEQLNSQASEISNQTKMHGCVCGQCLQTFTSRRGLAQHVQNVHGALRRFVCPHCKYTSNRKDNFKSHVQRRHSNHRPHHCSKCHKGFINTYELRLHEAVCHRRPHRGTL